MPPTTNLSSRCVTFAPYDVTQTHAHKKPSATAFATLRKALFQSQGKPVNPELPGAWRIAAEWQMLFSDMEYKHQEAAGMMPDASMPSGFREVMVPVIVLNPRGASFVVGEMHVQQLRAIFDEWVKSSAKHADAMAVHVTYQWFDGTGNIVNAAKESAVATGLVKPSPDAEPAPADIGVVDDATTQG